MKKMNSIFALAVLLGCTSAAAPQAERPLHQHTITKALDSWITNTERHLMPVADVMPEDKYSLAPAPTSGAFKDVRTFAQQLKHLAANNYLMAAFILGRKGNTELNNETGPEPIRTRAEITEYLRSSFVALHNAVATIDNNNVVEPMTSPNSWQKTGLSFAVDAVAHSFNHYGQLAEYLRMTGIVPPDSRTPEALLLLPSVLAVAETVTFPSGEISLHGVLYKPEGTGPFPAVIYNHGSAPGMMSKEAFAALGPVYASHGWVFFGPYRRGQGLSASAGPYIGDQIAAAEKAGGASAAAATMVRLLEMDHLDDQLAALAWLRKQNFVQPNRIAVAGTSFGGIETVLAAISHSLAEQE